MPKPQIAIFAAVAVAVLCLGIAVSTARRTPALSARVIEVINNWNEREVVVQVTNNTAYAYYPAFVGLEIWNGKIWATAPTVPRGLDLVSGEMWTLDPLDSTPIAYADTTAVTDEFRAP